MYLLRHLGGSHKWYTFPALFKCVLLNGGMDCAPRVHNGHAKVKSSEFLPYSPLRPVILKKFWFPKFCTAPMKRRNVAIFISLGFTVKHGQENSPCLRTFFNQHACKEDWPSRARYEVMNQALVRRNALQCRNASCKPLNIASRRRQNCPCELGLQGTDAKQISK